MLIDTHSHLYDTQFDADRAQALARAREAGVGMLLLPAIDGESYEAMYDLVRHEPHYCYPMMGLHPTSVDTSYRTALDEVFQRLDTPPEGIHFCAVGEIGLDYHWSTEFRAEQADALRRQCEKALALDLPVMIHTRDAWDDMCSLLEEFRHRSLRGVMHSFCGTRTHWQRLRACGDFCFGIGGPVTYKHSAIAALLPEMEASEIVLETDCPYLPPMPHRGERNESAYVALVAARVAELRHTTLQDVALTTTTNVHRLFRTLGR